VNPPLTMLASFRQTTFPVREYDLASTLTSGQAFRWERHGGAWEAVVHGRWVRLQSRPDAILVQTAEEVRDWTWIEKYLQVRVNLAELLETFPQDDPMCAAVEACRGLRLLRQDPWECLASFILSSSKQIVQIQQIVRLLCERFGESAAVPEEHEPGFAFPRVELNAACSETELRACKMGFRAPYLLETAQALARGEVHLSHLAELPVEDARAELLKLPGVGRKVADCVLLFAYGFQEAFPVDVWVMKALRQLYFARRPRTTLQRLHGFSARHFGPNAGYAQQYLFHYMRTKQAAGSALRPSRSSQMTSRTRKPVATKA